MITFVAVARRRLLAMLGVVCVVTGACGESAPSNLLAASPGYSDPSNADVSDSVIPGEFNADAIVELERFHVLDDFEVAQGVVNTAFELVLGDVVAQWDTDLSGGPEAVPALGSGQTIRAFEVRGFNGKRESRLSGADAERGQLVAFLDFQSGSEQSERGGNWSIHGVASITNDQVRFPRTGADGVNRFVDTARGVTSTGTGRELGISSAQLLEKLVDEVRAERAGEPEGELLTETVRAFRACTSTPAEQWNALPVAERPLESEAVRNRSDSDYGHTQC